MFKLISDDLLISMAVSVILAKIRDQAFMQKCKPALLKVRNSINAAFPGE